MRTTTRNGLPVYRCPRISREIELTGRIDDPLWNPAPVASLVRADTGEAPGLRTEVRLLCSDTTLYAGYHCEDDYIHAELTGRDAKVYDEECVELFLCPSGASHKYYEVNINPLNTVYDACILNSRVAENLPRTMHVLVDYDVEGIRTAVHVEGEWAAPGKGKYWSVEYAIPLAQLIGAPNTPPRAGDAWLMNLYRIDHPVDGQPQHYAWSRTHEIDFHRPWIFGTLLFE